MIWRLMGAKVHESKGGEGWFVGSNFFKKLKKILKIFVEFLDSPSTSLSLFSIRVIW